MQIRLFRVPYFRLFELDRKKFKFFCFKSNGDVQSDKTNAEEDLRNIGQRFATTEFRQLADLLSTSLSFRMQSDSGPILNERRGDFMI